ncbi:hypothetical protein KQX54_017929 [Cotesia glomerata]|uniref:Uncharacterized protein n=1 Tax=Cotesia glomerata TaxID=32391 RepID=A0AAV7J1J6_COTGL|nr:hypothetical protein KQX54_017929 [Cotesia glomerata]
MGKAKSVLWRRRQRPYLYLYDWVQQVWLWGVKMRNAGTPAPTPSPAPRNRMISTWWGSSGDSGLQGVFSCCKGKRGKNGYQSHTHRLKLYELCSKIKTLLCWNKRRPISEFKARKGSKKFFGWGVMRQFVHPENKISRLWIKAKKN